MKRFFNLLLPTLSGLLLLAAPAAQAQVTSMSLMGSVQSEEHRPLPGAAITVIHVPSGVRHAAASDGTGRFLIPNLMVGGPYSIKVGEGGYRPQTVENIYLETGKTANFTVVLNKLGEGKDRNNRDNSATNEPNGTTLTLAKEAVVGGPVLITTSTNQPQGGTMATSGRRSAAGGAAQPSAPMPAPAPVAAATPASVAIGPPPAPMAVAPAPTAAPAPVATAPRAKRRYSPRQPAAARVKDAVVPGHYDAKTGNYIYETGVLTTLKLANGNVISEVGINSTESTLYHFITDPRQQVDTMDLTRDWYNFDRVFFTPGKATLAGESMKQLRNIAAILHAYPNTRIKLGGYTDSTGTYQVNRQLSEARARTAWASLVEMGISPSRIDARGYGPRYAIAANDTEIGRAMNRRLSVRVLQK